MAILYSYYRISRGNIDRSTRKISAKWYIFQLIFSWNLSMQVSFVKELGYTEKCNVVK